MSGVRRHLHLVPDVIEGELAEPSPGWWVCPRCDRKIDREGTPQVRGRWCAGIDRAHRHPVTRMRAQR